MFKDINVYGVLFVGMIGISILLLLALLRAFGHIKRLKSFLSIEREVNQINRGRATDDGFYDNVLEADITNDCLIGENAAGLIKLLKLPPNSSYSSCIENILDQFIKEPYRKLYGDHFNRENLLKRYQEGEKKFTFEFEECADLIHYCWTRVTVCIYFSDTSQSVKIISYVKNIQKEKENELCLIREAHTDFLTGLYNKRAAEPMIWSIFDKSRGKSHAHAHALMIVDIDFFKQVNDTIGHAGGDSVLKMVARLLQNQMDSHDIVSRIGGDEFLILMKNCTSTEVACKKAKQLVKLATALDTSTYNNISLSLSIGIALYPFHADNYADLFNMADQALYCRKRDGRNGYSIFQPSEEIK